MPLELFRLFAQACSPGSGGLQIVPTWYKYLPSQNIGGKCTPMVTVPDSIVPIALAVVEILLRIAGMVAVLYIIYGGYLYILSAGDTDKAAAGRTTIINALVGLMLAMFATAIVNLVGRNI